MYGIMYGYTIILCHFLINTTYFSYLLQRQCYIIKKNAFYNLERDENLIVWYKVKL